MLEFYEDMERRFGSDEALGVTFICHGPNGRLIGTLSVAEYEKLPDAEKNHLDIESQFPDGTSAVCCTDYAAQIFKALPGRVQIFGFANEENPTSRVAREELHPGGHDFAVVDGRFIVDPWVRLVAGETGPIVLDLLGAEEGATALDTYGPRDCWTHMREAEQFALAHP